MKPGFAVLVAVLGLAACGSPNQGPDIASAVASNFRVTADPAHTAAGTTIHLGLTVSGPVDYDAGCLDPLNFWVLGAGGSQVWSEPVPMIGCLAIVPRHLAAGQAADFRVSWTTSSDLAPGRYTVHGLFRTLLPPGAGTRVRENLPPLTVDITG